MISLLCAVLLAAADDDWRGFRGTDASGRSEDPGVPPEWSSDHNLAWRTPLPGPGSSSPIVVGDQVFLTCWSGYGLDAADPGDPAKLVRHVVCLDRDDGAERWSVTVDRAEKEDPYEGRNVHGYASSTPVSDGERLYVFFGKRGVLAYDLDGHELWHADVGQGSSEWNTGSAASPALCGDLVLINAGDESRSFRALDKKTGDEVWRRDAEDFHLAFDTPVVVDGVIVLAMLEHLSGLDPKTGHDVWTVRTKTNGSLAPTPVHDADVLYSIGGQAGTRAYAVRLGGQGDVSDTHVNWSSNFGSYVPSPVLVDGHLYWVDERGMACCMVAATGEIVYRERVGGEFYASAVATPDAIYCTSRAGETVVLPAAPEFEVLARNRFDGDDSRFDGSPAISLGQLFLRSNRYCYCVAEG